MGIGFVLVRASMPLWCIAVHPFGFALLARARGTTGTVLAMNVAAA